MKWKVICSPSTIAALLLVATMVILSFYMRENNTVINNTVIKNNVIVLNLAILSLGVSVGWLLGILISPYDRKEATKFYLLTKAVGVFASGYIVGKIDALVGKLFNPDFVLDSIHGFRMIVFFTAAIVVMLFTFIYREYAT
jgi:hypothetical protein